MDKKYRKNVGIVLCRNGKVLLFARADQKALQWQFPQGGLEANEDIVEAAKRELQEETGLSKVKLLHVMQEPIKYDFPQEMIQKWSKNNPWNKSGYVGQEQYWVLFEFCGSDTEINFLTHPEEVEFKDYKWTDISEAVKEIIYFKKQVYQKVADCFTPYILENSHGN